jgi:Protein tyrosine phosphatase-like protein, PTPLA
MHPSSGTATTTTTAECEPIISWRRLWLIVTNIFMMLGWARVLSFFWREVYANYIGHIKTNDTIASLCHDQFGPLIQEALFRSFLEVLNAATGLTRSKPAQVLLFAVIRWGVESIVAPAISTTCPAAMSHLVTAVCWSLGDTIRFGCFAWDSVMVNGSRTAKYIRYTVGPILFPLGTLGEMWMVLVMAQKTYDSGSRLQAVAIFSAGVLLWPVGFYFLFTQLLRQRQKFLEKPSVSDEAKKVQ